MQRKYINFGKKLRSQIQASLQFLASLKKYRCLALSEIFKRSYLQAILSRLNPSSNDANGHYHTITTVTEMINYLLGGYVIDAIIPKTYEESRHFTEVSITPCEFFVKIVDLTLRCADVYNEQMMYGTLLKELFSPSAASCVGFVRNTVI